MRNVLLLLVVLLLAGCVPIQIQPTPPPPPAPDLSLVLSAYSYLAKDGTTWLGESGPFFNAMTERVAVTDLPFCDTAFIGKLSGQSWSVGMKLPTASVNMRPGARIRVWKLRQSALA